MNSMVNEEIQKVEYVVKRFHDCLKNLSTILELMEQNQWILKDVLEDLGEILIGDFIIRKKEEHEKPTSTSDSEVGVS